MRSVLLSTVAALGLFAGVNLAAAQNAADQRKEPAASEQKAAPRVQADDAKDKSKAAQEKGAKDQDKSKAVQEKTQPVKEKAAQELDKKPQPADGKAAQEKAQPAKEKAAEQAKPVENKAAQDKAKPAADKAPDKSIGQAKPVENKAVPDKAAQDKPAQDKAAQDKAAQDKSNPPKTTTATTPGSDKTTTSAAVVAPEKQTKISEVLAKEKVEPVTNVNFSISIGTTVPEHVRARRLPDEIVVIVPEYRGYDYIIVEEEIIIIEPRTRRIVMTIPRHGSRTAGVATTMRLTLSPEQRRMLLEIVLRENIRSVDARMEVIVGREIPRTVEVHKFSDRVYSEIPELRSYEFFVKESEVVLVRDKKIVEIID